MRAKAIHWLMEALKFSPKALKSEFEILQTDQKALKQNSRHFLKRPRPLSLGKRSRPNKQTILDCRQALSPAKHVTSVLLLAGLGR